MSVTCISTENHKLVKLLISLFRVTQVLTTNLVSNFISWVIHQEKNTCNIVFLISGNYFVLYIYKKKLN